MNNKKYKLTISLLASNRKDTLPKTLESLKPILDNVSSELIVVDTGCDEDLLEIVRQYTDKIEKFEWCKDFAKARNVGIDKAQGDWFMFIDDDEWFENVTEFIEFFNSDEMKKYNYGKYVVRNYENMEGTAWTDSIAGRMFRLFEGTRFIDAIHERPTNIAGPTKSFSAYAHHYGYVYKTEEDRRAHIKRNTDLLLEQIKKEPGCVRHYCHLTQEYNVIREYEKSLEYAYEGIKNADMKISENSKDISGLYGNVVWVMVNQLRYEEAINKAEEYLQSQYISELGKLSLYGFCATSAYKLGKYKEAIDYADKFFYMNNLFVKNPDMAYKQDATLIMMSLSGENIERITGIAFASAIMSYDMDNMSKYCAMMEDETKMLIDADECMKKLAEYMGEGHDKEKYVKILEKIMTNTKFFLSFLNRVEEIKNIDVNLFINIADVMAELDSEHGYVQFMRIVSKRNEPEQVLIELYEKAISDINDIINLHHHFWTIAHQRGISIAGFVSKKPMDRWMKTVDAWVKNVKVKDLIEKKEDLSLVLYTDGMHMKYFDVILAENLMYRKKLDGISIEEIKSEMIKYTNTVMSFYREIYKDSIFIECPTILPARCQVAMNFMKILCGDIKTHDEIKKHLNESVKIMPGIKLLTDKYIELMGM